MWAPLLAAPAFDPLAINDTLQRSLDMMIRGIGDEVTAYGAVHPFFKFIGSDKRVLALRDQLWEVCDSGNENRVGLWRRVFYAALELIRQRLPGRAEHDEVS